MNILFRLRQTWIVVHFVWVPAHVNIPRNENNFFKQNGKEKYSRSSLQENWKDRTEIHYYNTQNSIRQSKIIHNLNREYHLNKNKDGSYKTLFYTSYNINTQYRITQALPKKRKQFGHVLLFCPTNMIGMNYKKNYRI